MLPSDSEIIEYKGFVNLCKGFYGMYRNPKAHSSRKNEDTSLEQLAEVLVSQLLHTIVLILFIQLDTKDRYLTSIPN